MAAVSLAAIIAVLLFGFSIVIVGFSSNGQEKGQSAYCKVIFPTEVGSMNKTEPDNDDRSMFLIVPAVINASNIEHIKPPTKAQEFSKIRKIKLGRYLKWSTTTSISSKKAMEFTLVGAKPSGTG